MGIELTGMRAANEIHIKPLADSNNRILARRRQLQAKTESNKKIKDNGEVVTSQYDNVSWLHLFASGTLNLSVP